MTPPSLAQIDVVADRAAALPKPQRRKLARALAALGRDPGRSSARLSALLTPIQVRLAQIEDGDDAEARHVAKLDAAGQLRTGYLVRALREGKLGLFAAALSRLGGFARQDVDLAIESPDRPELLAMALAGAGLDRGAFPTALTMVRSLSGGRPGGGERGARRALDAFGPFEAAVYAAAFRKACEAS